MDELVNKLKKITNLSELENIANINTNELLCAIAESKRYDLLKNANIRLNTSDTITLEKLIDLLLSDEDILYYMHDNDFFFSKEELNSIFNLVIQKYYNSYIFGDFFRDFFRNKEELNAFIKDNKNFFEKYIRDKNKDVAYSLKDCDNFVELILQENNVKLVGNLEKYSLSNLKLLAQLLEKNKKIPYYLGNELFAQHLFELKPNLEPDEFYELLNLLEEKSSYDKKTRDSKISSFSALVNDNIDDLIEMASKTKIMPKCLVESITFRDECIKRNRIDLAVKCILPRNIMENELLLTAYCNELNIDSKNFYEQYKWILNYHEENNNIFNTLLATSLKSNIFNINKEHYERFINDVEVQINISKLNDMELTILSKILDIYDYNEYDISSMIVNVIKNIKNYQELINSLNIENISKQDLRKLVSILQLPDNQFQIKNIDSLQSYGQLKKESFVNNYNLNDLNANKDNLLKLLFNIDLTEAQFIDSKYCHNNDEKNILDKLKDSELPPEIFNYLTLINSIIDCNNTSDLAIIYNNLKDNKVYDNEIPFESYLRSKYTKLYSDSLYRIDERNKVYGPKDNFSNEISYKGKNIRVCVPRANFNFFVHCIGSCSLASDVTDTNYKKDWMDRPQLQDHFVACSYLNEKGIYSIRSDGSIILGFDSLEGGSVLGMGNTDIDSIGRYAKAYDGSRELEEENGSRARYFVPSEILKNVNNGYNEVVIERRNTDKSKEIESKRKPDYIIMMAESMEKDNFNYLLTLYQQQLSFISFEDREKIKHIGKSSELKKFLVKYKEIILQNANSEGIPVDNMANKYVDLLMKSKYFEDCLNASSEFNIPLVVVNKAYYFNKMLSEAATYDDETMESISEFYLQADESKKKQIFNMVAKKVDVTDFMRPKESNNFTIGF